MTAEEKHIIKELLVGCSPTLQRIINAHNKFTIAPRSEDGGNDEDTSMAMAGQLYLLCDTNNLAKYLSSVF